jgi:hypothetical protein
LNFTPECLESDSFCFSAFLGLKLKYFIIRTPGCSGRGRFDLGQFCFVKNLLRERSKIWDGWSKSGGEKDGACKTKKVLRQNVDCRFADRQNVDFQIVDIKMYIHRHH